MNEMEYEILEYCLRLGENTWVSEKGFALRSTRSYKTIKRALNALLQMDILERECGWYWSEEHGKMFQYYYRVVTKNEGGIKEK